MHPMRQSMTRRVLLALVYVFMAVMEGVGADYGYAMTPHEAGGPLVGTTSATGTPNVPDAARASPDANVRGTTTAPAAPAAVMDPDPGAGYVRLPGHVLGALDKATPLAPPSAREERRSLTLTLVLKRDDEPGFERYLHEVYDPSAPTFRHFLTQKQLADRFGPSRAAYESVLRDLRSEGFRTVSLSKNRLTLTVRGTRADAERAFGIHILDYKLGSRRFYANDRDPALRAATFAHVQAIAGLSNLATPRSVASKWPGGPAGQASWYALCMNQVIWGGSSGILYILGAFYPLLLPELFVIGLFLFLVPTPLPPLVGNTTVFQGFPQLFKCANKYNTTHGLSAIGGYDPPPPAWQSVTGTGQTIGLAEFDTYAPSDVKDYVALMGLAPTAVDNVTPVHVNGGASPGPDQDEVLLDIADVLTAAPGAKISVYDAPFKGPGSFQALFNQMINDKVTIISNSWSYCEDQTTLADVQSIDTILQTAAASGITVVTGSGDGGSTCLDGAANTIGVPADSPHVTSVGGTSMTTGPGFSYVSETWWDGSTAAVPTGQGGYGTSKFFSRPSYQSGESSSTMRSIPDVAIDADPEDGVFICQASNGGCPNGDLYGGTSSAAPSMAAYVALLNQSQGSNLGFLNPLLYPLANSDAFHNAASMNSDFAHVGLGSPNLARLHQALTKQTAGPVSQSVSLVSSFLPKSYMWPRTLVGDLAMPDFDDGVSPAYVVVNLADANGNTISGKSVTLAANSGSHALITPASVTTSADGGTAVFTVTDLSFELVTFTATDATDGITLTQTAQVGFGPPPASSAGISVNPSALPADGQTPATIVVTLKDSLNRPTPGKFVTISTTTGAHAVVTGPTPGVTDANGQIQFSATDQVNETVTFTAVDVSDGSVPVPGSGSVTYSGSTSSACGVGVVAKAGTGYSITPYITGLPAAPTVFYENTNFGCPGGNNPTFTSAGEVLVTDFLTGGVYQLGLAGGSASTTDLLTTLTPAIGTPVYGKDGNAYATSGGEGGEIVQINPQTGAIVRVVASGLTCPAGLSVDPLSGDLFFDDECTNGGTDNPSVWRIIDPGNTDASKPTSVVVYASLPSTPNGGMAFAPDGTLYAVSGYYYTQTAPVEAISGTNAATVTVSPVSGVTSDYAVAIGVTNADGSAQSLIVEPSGTLTEIPIANPSAGVVLATGSPGVGVTGPDGCLYSAHYDTIYRLANSSGGCNFTPTSPAPSIKLTPAAVSPNPVQGGAQTFTATLRNVSPLSGVPVIFRVKGANAVLKLVDTDSNGNAVLTYTAALAGTDTVTAGTVASGTVLASNPAEVTWTAGKHLSVVSLNSSPHGGTVNRPALVTATLVDLTVDPRTPVAGQTVTFSLGTSTCTAVTNASGSASCEVTAAAVGPGTLSVKFAGSSSLIAATAAIGFNVTAVPTPPPTVTIAVSPTSIAAGSTATLTWSSTNATSCTASGAWSGGEPTGGSAAVTPTTPGSYTYTLTCTGNGGSTAASAVLAATLVSVTVSAHSGGGAMSAGWLTLLGLLALLRLASARRGRALSSLLAVALGAALCLMLPHAARADQTSGAASTPGSFVEDLYIGIRLGGMPIRLDPGQIDAGLAARGFGGIAASSDTSAVGGTLYVGYEFAPHADLEFGYTHRNSQVASLAGTTGSAANVPALLEDTTGLIRGYGNIYSLSLRSPFEVAPRISVDVRAGGFVWATEVRADAGGAGVRATHEGGGVTVGGGAAYRLWRTLSLGIGVDYFRGSPRNDAALYSGTLEWRFGR